MPDATPTNSNIRTYAKDMAQLSGKGPLSGTKPLQASNTDAATDANREGVLARLRERAAKDPVHEADLLPNSLPTPLPKVAAVGEPFIASKGPEPVEEKPPVLQTPPPPVFKAPPPPVVPAPPPPPPIPLKPKTPPVEVGPSPLHTYTSDFSDRIDTKQASAFSVLAAQSDAGDSTTPAPVAAAKKKRNLLIPIASVVLILVGAGAAFGAYRYVATHSIVAITASIPSLVFADDRAALTGEGPQLLQALAASAATSLPQGQVRVVYLTEASTTPDGGQTTVALSGGRLIGALQLSAPDILLRNIATESTVGIVHAGPETRAFFIMKVLSYERTFAGMLQWESMMANSLAVLYPPYPTPQASPVTSATTTKTVNGKKVTVAPNVASTPTVTVLPHFVDEVASNHDVRALKDSEGRTILLYGYKDKETLVIARNEAAFAELLNRLSATKQQ